MAIRQCVAAVLVCAALSACGFQGAYTAQRSPSAGPARVEAPQPAPGSSWSYRLVNGYNSEVRAQFREEYTAPEGPGLAITRSAPDGTDPIVERYTADWKWISKARPGFDLIEYSPPLEALPFPLEVGKSWRHRSISTNRLTGERYPVYVLGRVVGWEKIKTAAGTYDAIRVDRDTYLENGDFWKSQTHIVESEWYAPALGRIVRSENTSGYYDLAQTSQSGALWVKGDWNVLELEAPAPPARPRAAGEK